MRGDSSSIARRHHGTAKGRCQIHRTEVGVMVRMGVPVPAVRHWPKDDTKHSVEVDHAGNAAPSTISVNFSSSIPNTMERRQRQPPWARTSVGEEDGSSATTIQRVFRGYAVRKKFKRVLHKWRRYVRKKGVRRALRSRLAVTVAQEDESATRVQRVFRGYVVRRRFATILSKWRRYVLKRGCRRAQKSLAIMQTRQNSAARAIQCRYKSWTTAREQSEDRGVGGGEVRVGSRYKESAAASATLNDVTFVASEEEVGFRDRIELELAMRRIVRLQSLVRMHAARRAHSVQLANTITVSMVVAETEVDAATVNLNYSRCHPLACTKHRKKGGVAVPTVAPWSATVARSLYTEGTVVPATAAIQSTLRRKAAVTRYSRARNGTIVLQALARGSLVRNGTGPSHLAALAIGRVCRGRLARKEFRLAIAGTTSFQAFFRGHLASGSYAYRKRSAERIQGRFRAWIVQQAAEERVRIMLCERDAAAVLIQTRLRGLFSHVMYCHAVRCTVLLEAVARRFLATSAYRRRREVALFVQRASRGAVLRAEVRSQRIAAVKIQCVLRRSLALSAYNYALVSAVLVQSGLRRAKAETLYSKARTGSIRLQAVVRRVFVKNRLEVTRFFRAAEIQASWRRHVARSNFFLAKEICVKLQAGIRMRRERTLYRKQVWAAALIQGRFRTRRVMVAERRRWVQSLIVLQSAYSRRVVVRAKNQQVRAAMTMQARFRGLSSRQSFHRTVERVVLLQALARRYLKAADYDQKRREAALVLQRIRRGAVEKAEMRSKRVATLAIQRTWRGSIVRSSYLDAAVYVVAILWTLQRFVELHLRERATSSIQHVWRQRATLERLRSARAICIQRFWRGLSERMDFAMTMASVVLLQSSFRRKVASGRYSTTRNGCVLLQGRVRGALVRDTLHDMAFFASEIQRTWKGYRAQLEFTVAMQHIKQLQSVSRVRAARRIYNAQANAATLIQREIRSWLMVLAETEADAATIIQNDWRSYQLACTKQRENFAAIFVQTWWRVTIARSLYMEIVAFVVVIQSTIRRTAALTLYSKARNGVVAFQPMVRGALARDKIKLSHFAATEIERIFRGRLTQIKFWLAIKRAIKVQTHIRGHVTRALYLSQKTSARLIQSRFRSWKIQAAEREIQSIILLQSVCRRLAVVRAKLHETKAAVLVQTRFRVLSSRLKFCDAVGSSVLIQTTTRCMLAMTMYQRRRDVALLVQRIFRGGGVRAEMRSQCTAAITIQRILRGCVACSAYKSSLESTFVIQSAVRCMKASTLFSTARNGTIHLQAVIRRSSVRRNLELAHFSASEIQISWRKYVAQRNLLLAKKSIIRVQTRYRTHRDENMYQKQMSAVKRIQCIFRTWKIQAAEREIKSIILLQSVCRRLAVVRAKLHETKAAGLVQTRFRGLSVRLKFCDAVGSSVLLQATTRCMLAMAMYQRRRDVALLVQRIFRGGGVRAEMRSQCTAAITIQRTLRGFVACSAYKSALESTFVLQSAVRCMKASTLFSTARNGTIHLQVVFRRASVRRNLELAHFSASEIQTSWRKYVAQRNLVLAKKSIIRVQTRYRTHRNENMHQKQMFTVKRIQCMFRTWKMQAEEREIKSIILVQSFCRRHMVFLQNCRNYDAAVLLQARIRAYFSMCAYRDAVGCIVLLQARCRCSLASNALNTKRKSMVLIQRVHRGSVARGDIHSKRNSSIFIQHAWRGACARSAYIERCLCATVLQAAVRRSVGLVRYGKARNGTIVLQDITRGILVRNNGEHQLFAASELQRIVRTFLARKRFILLLQSAVQMQEQIRMLLALRSYRKQSVSINRIQRRYRAWMLQVAQNEIKSITCLQSMIRRHMAIGHTAQKNSAAATIQSHYRVLTTRRNWDNMSSSAVILQAVARGLFASKCYHVQKDAAIKAQITYRLWQITVEKEEIAAITVLQSTLRRHVASKQMVRQHCSVVIMQAMARGVFQRQHNQLQNLAVIGVQRVWRGWKTQIKLLLLVAASTKLQAKCRRLYDKRVYSQTRRKVIKLQAFVKATIARNFLRGQSDAAIKIQKMWRGVRLYGEYALLLRRYFTRSSSADSACRALLDLKAAKVQALFRCWCCRSSHIRKLAATRRLHSCFFLWRARTNTKKIQAATLRLQSATRTYLARSLVRKTDVAFKTVGLIHCDIAMLDEDEILYGKTVRTVTKEISDGLETGGKANVDDDDDDDELRRILATSSSNCEAVKTFDVEGPDSFLDEPKDDHACHFDVSAGSCNVLPSHQLGAIDDVFCAEQISLPLDSTQDMVSTEMGKQWSFTKTIAATRIQRIWRAGLHERVETIASRSAAPEISAKTSSAREFQMEARILNSTRSLAKKDALLISAQDHEKKPGKFDGDVLLAAKKLAAAKAKYFAATERIGSFESAEWKNLANPMLVAATCVFDSMEGEHTKNDTSFGFSMAHAQDYGGLYDADGKKCKIGINCSVAHVHEECNDVPAFLDVVRHCVDADAQFDSCSIHNAGITPPTSDVTFNNTSPLSSNSEEAADQQTSRKLGEGSLAPAAASTGASEICFANTPSMAQWLSHVYGGERGDGEEKKSQDLGDVEDVANTRIKMTEDDIFLQKLEEVTSKLAACHLSPVNRWVQKHRCFTRQQPCLDEATISHSNTGHGK